MPKRNRLAVTFGRGRSILPNSPPAAGGDVTAPTVTSLTAPNVTQTSITIAWSLSEVATGRVEWGTTLAYGNFTTKETSFDYSTHVQTITGLVQNAEYHVRVLGEDAAGNTYLSGDFAVTTAADVVGNGGYTYDDLTLPTSWTHNSVNYSIDHTGVVDSTAGVNYWVQDNAGGTNTTNHKRLIFPSTATIRVNTGICIGGSGANNTTLWGHAATSSAWIRGNATSYTDIGCKLIVDSNPNGPYGSAFIFGSNYLGNANINFGQTVTDAVVRGFDIYGPSSTPGRFGANEANSTSEYGDSFDCQFAYNKARGMPGDLVRFRSSVRGWVHHNYSLDQGRMGCTTVVNITPGTRADNLYEQNTVDHCGYWGIDVETEDETNTSLHYYDGLVVRNNVFGSFGSTTQQGAGFCTIEYVSQHIHVADIQILDNVVDGTGWGNYGTGNTRGIDVSIADQLSTGVATGQDPRLQRITISGNAVTHAGTFAGPIVKGRYTDTLIVTNNDANLSSGSFVSTFSVTGLVDTGNT